MAAIPEEARAVIEAGRLAHLVTMNSDGSPQVTCVWVAIEGDELVTGHLRVWQKVKNVRRDPRVVVSIESDRINERGLTEYLVVYGHARVQEGGAPDLLRRVAKVYLGPDVRFPPLDNPPAGYVLRITPDRFAGMGPWSSTAQQRGTS